MQTFAPPPVRALARAATSDVSRARLAEPCNVLIVEGRRGSLAAIQARAADLGYLCTSVATPRQVIEAVGRDANLGIVLIEATPHNADGSRLLKRLPSGSAIVPIVVAEAPSLPQAIRVLRLGARDLLLRDAPRDQVASSLRRAAAIWNKATLRDLWAGPSSQDDEPSRTEPAPATPQERLRHEIELHDARQAHFDRVALGDRAWRILVELAAASVEGRKVTASMLARATKLHTSAITQCIARLVQREIVEQCRDSADRRNVFVRLREPILSEILSAWEA